MLYNQNLYEALLPVTLGHPCKQGHECHSHYPDMTF